MAREDFDIQDDHSFRNEMSDSDSLGFNESHDYDEDYDYDENEYESNPDDFYDDDFIEISDIDFSSMSGTNLKQDLKRVNKAIGNKRVVSRHVSKRPIEKGRPALKPRVESKRPIERGRPVLKPRVESKRPIEHGRPVLKPRVESKRPIDSGKPILKPRIESKRPIEKGRPVLKPRIESKRPIETRRPISKITPSGDVLPVFSNTNPLLKQRPKPILSNDREIPVNKRAIIHGKNDCKTTKKIIVPRDRNVIIEGVDKFLLTDNTENDAVRNIGYYKNNKLKELVLIINNDTLNDFDFELFNPSMPLDYLFSTTQNLNNKILVAGDNKVSYSDMLYNILANPTMIPNAKFVVTGSQVSNQYNQPMFFKNKNIAGHEKISPIQNSLNIDLDQQQKNIVYWDITQTLGRLFVPNGMDVIKYKVLAGNTVVFGFYYDQMNLAKFFFPEIRNNKTL